MKKNEFFYCKTMILRNRFLLKTATHSDELLQRTSCCIDPEGWLAEESNWDCTFGGCTHQIVDYADGSLYKKESFTIYYYIEVLYCTTQDQCRPVFSTAGTRNGSGSSLLFCRPAEIDLILHLDSKLGILL